MSIIYFSYSQDRGAALIAWLMHGQFPFKGERGAFVVFNKSKQTNPRQSPTYWQETPKQDLKRMDLHISNIFLSHLFVTLVHCYAEINFNILL